eukprot:209675-Pyramimonas_sp.AAC.1
MMRVSEAIFNAKQAATANQHETDKSRIIHIKEREELHSELQRAHHWGADLDADILREIDAQLMGQDGEEEKRQAMAYQEHAHAES